MKVPANNKKEMRKGCRGKEKRVFKKALEEISGELNSLLRVFKNSLSVSKNKHYLIRYIVCWRNIIYVG